MKLRKETINSIKHFLKYEAQRHKYGTWDKLEITHVQIRTDGNFSFTVHYLWKSRSIFDTYEFIEGNLNDYPIGAVLDGLDVAKLIFYPIHKKACERVLEHTQDNLNSYQEEYEYISKIYNV